MEKIIVIFTRKNFYIESIVNNTPIKHDLQLSPENYSARWLFPFRNQARLPPTPTHPSSFMNNINILYEMNDNYNDYFAMKAYVL